MCEWLKQSVLKTDVRETVPGVRIPLPPPRSLKCTEYLRCFRRNTRNMPVFRDNCPPKRTGEKRLLRINAVTVRTLLWEADGQSGFTNSVRRMQCDHKPMTWRRGVTLSACANMLAASRSPFCSHTERKHTCLSICEQCPYFAIIPTRTGLQRTNCSAAKGDHIQGSSSFARLERMQSCVARCNRWRNITLQHQPQNSVVELIIDAIWCAEIQPLRQARGRSLRRILFIQVLRGDHWVISLQVGRQREDVCQGSAEVIKLRKPPHDEDVLDRRDHVRRVDEAMHRARPVVGRDGIEGRAV